MQAFEKAGFRFFNHGTLQSSNPQSKRIIADCYIGDELTDAMRQSLTQSIPYVQFGQSRSQYAPELVRHAVIVSRVPIPT